MARQRGVIKYLGTIGEIRHFRIKGEKDYFAGLIGGPTKEQVLTDPAFQRTRENMNEFGGCALAGKLLRTAFSSLLKSMADNRVTGRITAIMKKINLEDGSEARGQRAVLITQAPQYLEDFEFNKNLSTLGVFKAPYTLTEGATRESATLDIPAFNPASYLNVPAGATHFRLILGIAAIPDVVMDTTENAYIRKIPRSSDPTDIQYSDYTAVDAVTSAISVVATLPNAYVPTSDESIVTVLGIEFYQEVNANYYLFNGGNAMRIEKIF